MAGAPPPPQPPLLTSRDRLDLDLARYAHYSEAARARQRVIADLSFLGLKTMSILSGGAIIALFTLLGHLDSLAVRAGLLWTSFGLFSASLIFTQLTTLIGYLAQNHIMALEARSAEEVFWASGMLPLPEGQTPVKPGDFKRANFKLGIAICSIFLAVILFGAGCATALSAVSLKASPSAATSRTPMPKLGPKSAGPVIGR